METTNFDKKDSNEDGVITPEKSQSENIEQVELSSPTENIADINKIEEQIVGLEGEIKKHVEQTNEVRLELGLPPETVENIPALKTKLTALDKLKNYIKNTAKAVTMAGIMLAGTSEAVGQTTQTFDKNGDKLAMNDLEEVRKKNMEKWVSKNYDLVKAGKLAPGTVLEGPDGNKYKIGAVLDNNLLKKNQDNESIDGPDNNTKKINISSFFKTGTVEYVDKDAELKAEQSVRDFLDSINDLENSSIRVLGTYSVDRKWGDISVENPDGDKNTQIAKAREQAGLALLKKIIKEKYGEDYLQNLEIESMSKGVALSDKFSQEEIDNMTDLEKQKEIDLNQGMSLEVVKKIINKAEKMEISPEEKEYLNAAFVILDKSKSMENDSEYASKIIEKINKNTDSKIKTLTLEGGNNEAHLQTLEKALVSLDESSIGKDIIVITDEPDNTLDSDSYDQQIAKVLELAKEKKVNILLKLFNPKMGPSASAASFVTLKLDDYSKNALKAVSSIPNMKYQTNEDKLQYWFNAQAQDSGVAVGE
ncbi:MAG: hypothetical protein WC011_01970 [Candidatus Paceibacterota bacterium]